MTKLFMFAGFFAVLFEVLARNCSAHTHVVTVRQLRHAQRFRDQADADGLRDCRSIRNLFFVASRGAFADANVENPVL